MKIETLAVHAGHAPDPATGAVTPPIHLSTTFEREADGSYPHGYSYSRSGNPTRAILETSLQALEGGGGAAAFASGSAATLAIFQVLAPGDHVIAPRDIYYGTTILLEEVFARWGLEATFVDMDDLDQVRAALRDRTRLLWVETPSNPLMKITDIAGVVAIAREVGALVAVDNTWASPVLQRPLDLGADLVLHSTTKYFGGHSDVTGGAIIAREDTPLFTRIRRLQTAGGLILSPFDCWLTLRGIRSLPYRVRAHAENAARVAEYLTTHPQVEAVHYPGLPSHPGRAVAARQMTLPGGMVSIQVRGGRDAAIRVAARVKLFTRATSLGGVESFVEHRASIEPPTTRTPQNLLRLSIGLEHPDDLVADLTQALQPADQAEQA